jgi:thioredoxin-like negative regulator of GroEL
MNSDKIRTIEIGEVNFKSEVLASKEPVLVAFLAPWSRPCGIVEAMLDDVAAICVGRWKSVKVNVDNNPGLGVWYDIESIPTLLFFVAGRMCFRIVGTVSIEAILSRLEAIAGDPEHSETAAGERPI